MSEIPHGGQGSGPEGFAPPGDYGPPIGDAPQYFPSPAYAPQPPQPPQPPHGQYPPNAPYPPNTQYPPQPYPGGYYGPPMLRQQTSGMAVAGMVLGILSLLFFWAWVLGPVLSVAGIVFSAVGMSQGSKPGWTGKGMAIAGLVCSLITAAIWVFLVIVVTSLLTH